MRPLHLDAGDSLTESGIPIRPQSGPYRSMNAIYGEFQSDAALNLHVGIELIVIMGGTFEFYRKGGFLKELCYCVSGHICFLVVFFCFFLSLAYEYLSPETFLKYKTSF